MVTACIVGDVINAHRNYVAAINTEGWLFIFDVPIRQNTNNSISRDISPDQAQGASSSKQHEQPPTTEDGGQMTASSISPIKLSVTYDQRMPANCKDLLLADLDGDGQNELIVGLTDRVLRTYRWITIGPDRGKFVGLYKWEFADQIGAVSLNPSQQHENCQDIIVAQPGGTYAKLECFDKKSASASNVNPVPNNNSARMKEETSTDDTATRERDVSNDGDDDNNVRTEYISKLTPEYHQLALAQMRNHHISTEVLGGIRDGKDSDTYSLIVIATLDGTLMLVNKDETLWSIQVDHQLFALALLESTPKTFDPTGPKLTQSESTCTIVANSKFDNNLSASSSYKHAIGDLASAPAKARGGHKRISQYFAVCAWNGKTYIVDEERNYLRFKFDEAVSAFTAGNYYFDGSHHSALVYATFNNQIVLYFDVLQNQIRPVYLLNEVLNNPQHVDLLDKLKRLNKKVHSDEGDDAENSVNKLRDLLHNILYSVTDQELGISP